MRVRITLACTECKQRNYNMTKEKKNHPDRMETNKYCRFCRKHTLHNISWPDRKTLIRETITVTVVSVVLGVIIATLDMVLQYGINFLV